MECHFFSVAKKLAWGQDFPSNLFYCTLLVRCSLQLRSVINGRAIKPFFCIAPESYKGMSRIKTRFHGNIKKRSVSLIFRLLFKVNNSFDGKAKDCLKLMKDEAFFYCYGFNRK